MKSLCAIVLVLAGAGFPAGAEAHVLGAAGGGFGAGVMHFLSGPNHVALASITRDTWG